MDGVYLALGDSMSIDDYTGVKGGGAASQFHRGLPGSWRFVDRTYDGCMMAGVPVGDRGDVITLTIGGNDALMQKSIYLVEGIDSFVREHLSLLERIRKINPESCFIVGNIYAPQTPLPEKYMDLLRRANEAIEENTAKVGGHLADIFGVFQGNEESYLCYEIEPTLQGARAIAGLFRKKWENWLYNKKK